MLFGRSAIQPVYLFVPFHLMAEDKCFSDRTLYATVKSSALVVQLKLCLLMKLTYDDVSLQSIIF